MELICEAKVEAIVRTTNPWAQSVLRLSPLPLLMVCSVEHTFWHEKLKQKVRYTWLHVQFIK
jgi:hypothetical protein